MVATAIVALTSACMGDATSGLRDWTPPAHDTLARQFLEAMQSNDTDFVFAHLSPQNLKMPGIRDSVRVVIDSLLPGRIDTLRQVDVKRFRMSGVTSSTLRYEYHTPSGWEAVEVVVIEELGLRYVHGFHGVRIPQSMEVMNAFTVTRNGDIGLLVLAIAVGCAGFSVVVLVLALLRIPKRRVLWALFALVGVAPVTFNWSTGEVSFQMLRVLLVPASYFREGIAGPWLISVAFPIGAISTFIRIKKLREENVASPETPQSESAVVVDPSA